MKTFVAPMVDISEFTGFAIEPVTSYTSHSVVTSGSLTYHQGQVLQADLTPGNVHRGYPSWQPYRTEGAYGPCRIRFKVKYGFPTLSSAQWVSLATFARATGDVDWDPVTFNVDQNGQAYWFHTPTHNQGVMTVLGGCSIPQNKWVQLEFYIDLSANGTVIAYIDGGPACSAQPTGGTGTLPQFHAGLYCEGSIASGYIANSYLVAQEVGAGAHPDTGYAKWWF